MATITLKGNEIHTAGDIPVVGGKAPDFHLTNGDLQEVSVADFAGKKKLLNIFPSIDTPVCAISTKKFNDYAREHEDTVMLMISADLPFAQKRFCADEVMTRYHAPRVPDLPRFTGGAVGFLGYEAARWFEPSLERAWEQYAKLGDSESDDAGFMLFDTVLAFDHVKHRILIIANAHVEGL